MTGALEADEIRALLEAIWSRYGYDLRGYAPSSIERRLRAALARSDVRDLGELHRRVLAEPRFFAEVLDTLTVRVSDLFRDPPFYAAFRAHVVPLLRTYPLLRIWHSGCATGEEAYASAILLTEEGLYERAQLYATDLSEPAIEHAKQGIYPSSRLPAFVDNHRQAGGAQDFMRYCTTAYDRIAFHETLRRNILFFQHDLVVDQAFGEMHVVFCRNVLIYFDRALQAQVVDKLGRSLCPGGFLCLGSSEQLPRTTPAFARFAPAPHTYRHVA